jgi:hypothetical protein
MEDNNSHMKVKMLLLIGGVVVLVVAAILLMVLNREQPEQVAPPVEEPEEFPISGDSPLPPSGDTAPLQTMTVIGSQNERIITKDFIHNGVTVADTANEGSYILTGRGRQDFSIGYSLPGGAFTIALQTEPLGEVRRRAETYLLDSLGISKNQLCSLKYYLGTDSYTNSLYAGQNLGFSFCPGATQLP